MISGEISASRLAEQVADAGLRFGVPGAQAVLINGGVLTEAAYGVLRRDTSAPVRGDSRFQIGSSIKMLTAALVMVGVDRGLVALDEPVRSYLPTFRVADEQASARITVRHLMTHTGGFDGEFFSDTGPDDDCLRRYVAACAGLEQIASPGELHSYSNAGFPVLAYLSEVVFDMSWRSAVSAFVTQPLGMSSFAEVPALLGSRENIAYGHSGTDGAALAPMSLLESRCLAPAGAGPLCSAADLARFGNMLLKAGTPVLSAAGAALMTSRQVEGPSETFASAWGLGTMLFDWTNEQTLFGHDGAVPGQYTYVRLHQASQAGLVIMTNGGDTAAFANAMFEDILAPIVGARPRPVPAPALQSILPLSRYCGTYGTRSGRLSISALGQHLRLVCRPTEAGKESVPELTVDLHPIDRERFVGQFPGRQSGLIQRFLKFDDLEVPQAVNFRGRVFLRLGHERKALD